MRLTLLISLVAIGVFAQSPEARTRTILDQLLAGKCDAFYAMFSPEMKGLITLDTFSTQMKQIAALGSPESIGQPHSTNVADSTVIVIPVHWASVSLNFQVSWNKAGQVDGTYWRPGDAAQAPWQPPTYVHPDSFTPIELTVGDDPWKLPATLTMPKGDGPFLAVVLVHGSGPEDRDETILGSKVFRDLAEGLSSHGVAVLRYVKRTKQYPQQCAAESKFTMNEETVDDALQAAVLLRKQPRIDPARVFVLGHSQGGYMAPRIMKRDPKLAGFIVFAGNVRPLEELIVEQSQYIASLKGTLTAPEQAQLDAIKKNPLAQSNLPEPYLADLHDYHPDLEAAALHMPMLILQGERDYQVTMKDFALWQAALAGHRNVTFHSYPKLNHLFIAGEGKPSPDEYSKPGHVDEQVILDIAHWVQRQ
jgi:dienelactone hydrolase